MNKRLIILNVLLVVAIIGSWLIFMGDFRQTETIPEMQEAVQNAEVQQQPEEKLQDETVTKPQTEVTYTEVEEVPEITEPEIDTEKLQQLLNDFCENQDGDWSIAVETLDGKMQANVNGDASMVSASLIKLFVMAAVYDQIEQGVIAHEDVIDLIKPMITVSDNTATNRLIEKLGDGDADRGMEIVNAYANGLGCGQTKLCRLMLADNGLQNYTSAADCTRLLREMGNMTCVNEKWSGEMLEILKGQTIRTRIPSGLPEGVSCGNKTGDLIALCCADVGIVFTEKGDYIICLICNNQPNEPTASFAMAELSGNVYTWMMENRS